MNEVIPNLYSKQPIPSTIPKELSKKISEFKKYGKQEFVRKAFSYVTTLGTGCRLNHIIRINRLFDTDLDKILSQKGYKYCTTLNYVLRVMLVKSGFFSDEDITLGITHTWFISPHQYLILRISPGKFVYLDPWSYHFGCDFGGFASGFKIMRIFPIR